MSNPTDNNASTVSPASDHTASDHTMAQRDPKWQTFQMLPSSFAQRRISLRILYGWAAVNFILFALLCSLVTVFWIQGKHVRSKRSDIVRAAYPLVELRRQCERMERDTLLQNRWVEVVNSTKPDDSALQTLLAVSKATAATENAIEVQSVEVRMPLEHAANGTAVPDWAKPRLLITADVANGATADRWHKRIESFDRVTRTSLRTPNGNWANRTVQVSGEPVPTKVLP